MRATSPPYPTAGAEVCSMQVRQSHTTCPILGVVTLILTGVASLHAGDKPRPVEYLFPAQDVDPAVLKSDAQVVVTETAERWSFAPAKAGGSTALLFFPGGGVDPMAYAPLCRAVAAEGWAVHLVRLPGKLAAPDQHRRDAIARGQAVIKAAPAARRWVVGGHSMGGSIAARYVHDEPKQFCGLILIGTTHPRDFDLSGFPGDVTKVYGTEDRVAKQSQSEANKRLLPAGTKWVRVEGGNHAQFGCYGTQPGDGKATISRDVQQRAVCEALAEALRRVSRPPE